MTDAEITSNRFVAQTPNARIKTTANIFKKKNVRRARPFEVEIVIVFACHATPIQHANATLSFEPETPKIFYFKYLIYAEYPMTGCLC